jgi:uncharacterized iron-regulated protein
MIQTPSWRFVHVAALGLLLAACAGRDLPADIGSTNGIPIVGRVLDTRSGEFISRDEAVKRVVAARYVILGEVHDNTVHHQLQKEIFQALLQAGRSPALAMEQFDLENQPRLDAARARGERDPERLADAGRFDRQGWLWPDYKPLVDIAAAGNLPLFAANFSREDARALMKSGRPAPALAPARAAERAALEHDIIDGHCGVRPSATLLGGMVEAQRARDARMAEVLERGGDKGVVLIAGKGHARRDRGVPSYMGPALLAQLLSVGFEEVAPDGSAPRTDYAGIYDLVWFTPRATRDDPCRNFRLPQK